MTKRGKYVPVTEINKVQIFFFQEDTAVKIILRRDLQTSKEFGVELMMKTLKTKMGKKVAITNSWENNH